VSDAARVGFGTLSPVARDRVSAGGRYPSPDLSSGDSSRFRAGQLRPPSATNKLIRLVRCSSAGVQGFPTSDSHDRHYRHATVIIAGPFLLLLPFRSLSISAGWRIADFVPVSLLFSLLALRFSGSHNETRSHEPLRPDTPRRDSCCPARIISILSSPVWMA
jgi:hypothetical protein